MPAVLAYPLLGFIAGNLILIGIGQLAGFYGVVFYPLLLVAIGVGILLARARNRRAHRAFVWGCLGVILASLIVIPFGTNGPPFLAVTLVGLAAGALVSQRRVDVGGGAAAQDRDHVGR